MVNIHNEQEAIEVNVEGLQHQAQQILDLLDYSDYDLGILLTSNEAMREYNKKYRNKDATTDILSFPFHALKAGLRIEPEGDDDKNLGDIIIAPEYVQKTLAKWPEKDLAERLKVLLVHGVCHLLGYDHIEDDEYKVMKEKEDWLLLRLR